MQFAKIMLEDFAADALLALKVIHAFVAMILMNVIDNLVQTGNADIMQFAQILQEPILVVVLQEQRVIQNSVVILFKLVSVTMLAQVIVNAKKVVANVNPHLSMTSVDTLANW